MKRNSFYEILMLLCMIASAIFIPAAFFAGLQYDDMICVLCLLLAVFIRWKSGKKSDEHGGMPQ